MSKTTPVTAQWALEGKQLDGEGYRILACSTGDLDRANFADAISRFQLGELNTLPQVSVSYARLGTQPGTSYLALAIHWYATEGQRYADEVWQRDDQGRPTAYTSYFCLPYRLLAGMAIGYQAIYEALRAVTLTVTDGPPVEVPIAMTASRIPAADDLAVRVAPLLLTGRQVCVLGAEATTMLERLEFIDSVMGLLPYGFRSRMTAATWTRASNRNHRFRLFFSSASRAGEPDHVVNWSDNPELVDVPDGEAREYLDWLQESAGPLARLAELTSEMGFGQKDLIKALESVLGVRQRFQLRHRSGSAERVDTRTGQPTPGPAPAPIGDEGELLLRACAIDAKLPNGTRLRTDIGMLRRFAEDGIDEKRRKRYLDQITRLGLLQASFLLREPGHLQPGRLRKDNKYADWFYDVLLRMAAEGPLSYPGYCAVEKCAGIAHGAAPHQELLAAIGRAGSSDPVVRALMHWHQREADEKKYNRWLTSGEVNATDLISALAGIRLHALHARDVFALTLDYLKKARGKYDLRQVRGELSKHGFLARALLLRYPASDQYQLHVLYQFLKVAYPRPAETPGQDLSSAAIAEILDGGGPPPTPALLAAVLMLLDSQEACQLAWNSYIHGSLVQSKFADNDAERLQPRLPHIDAATISMTGPWAEKYAARSGADMIGQDPDGQAQ